METWHINLHKDTQQGDKSSCVCEYLAQSVSLPGSEVVV